MANIGFRKVQVASLTAGVYGTPATVGKAISMSVTPNYTEASLYGDDILAEYEKAFVDADITLGTTYIPAAVQAVMFGHTVATDEVTSKADDDPGYCGLGAIAQVVKDGTKTFEAIFFPKVKFSEPEGSYETKGDSVTYNTPSFSGKALADETTKIWRVVKGGFADEATAQTWLTSQFS